MKNIQLLIIVFSLLTLLSCNNQQNKKSENNSNVSDTSKSEKSINNESNKTEHEEIMPREYLVTEILITSPRYKQITTGLNKAVVKNGGQSFGITLEGSPNPTLDKANNYSITYDYTVYEIYDDRHLNVARFSFNPNTKQLYEYDVVADKLKPIEFDKNILLKYEALNKY